MTTICISGGASGFESFEALQSDPFATAAAQTEAQAILEDGIADVRGRNNAKVHEQAAEGVEHLFDPQLPTVGLDARNAFAGSELIGQANARRDQRKINIVYVDTATSGLLSVPGPRGHILHARSGYVIGANGMVTLFTPDTPIRMDAFESVDLELAQTLSEKGVHMLTDPVTAKQYEDKQTLRDIAEVRGIVTPERYAPEELTAHSDIVIKPSDASQGRGVFFSSRYPGDVRQWLKYYDFLAHHDYSPVIEERIRPWPIHDPRTGRQLDWNVRSILSKGEYIDMYVRAGEIDTPINKSTGARTLSISGLRHLLRKEQSGSSARILTHALENASQDLAESAKEVFIAGADILIDQYGRTVVYEVNAGRVGGLQTIARNARTQSERFRNAQIILEALERTVQKSEAANLEAATTVPISVHAKYDFVTSSGNSRHVNVMLGENLDGEYVSRVVKTSVLARYLGQTVFLPRGSDDEMWRRMPPLELPMLRKYVPITIMYDNRLREIADTYYESDPLSAASNVLIGYAAATNLDITTVRRSYQFLDESGKRAYRDEIQKVMLGAVLSYDKDIDTDRRVVDYAAVLMKATLEEADEQQFAALCKLSDDGEYDAQMQSRLRSIALRMAILNDHFALAVSYLRTLDDSQLEALDAVTEFLGSSAERLLQSEQGVKFLLEDGRDLVTPLTHLGSIADKLGVVCTTAIADSLARIYCESETDAVYFRHVLESAMNGDPVALIQPDESSHCQLLAYVAACCLSGWYEPTAKDHLAYIKRVAPELYDEADFLQDWATIGSHESTIDD